MGDVLVDGARADDHWHDDGIAQPHLAVKEDFFPFDFFFLDIEWLPGTGAMVTIGEMRQLYLAVYVGRRVPEVTACQVQFVAFNQHDSAPISPQRANQVIHGEPENG